mmetsp:Transcript_3683/g.7875  ORF Transcript_3683/g.7875 Transcript_3683/m.7875 type:complete len:380 (-) Transcript_3683:116-1255(-)
MSLEAFIDIRFADPVVALTLNFEALVYGSMMGRVLHYQFATGRERVVCEREDECIRGAWISVDNCLYYAVGDLRGVVMQNPELSYSSSQVVEPGKVHTVTSCPYTLVVMHEDIMALLTLDSASPAEQLAALPAQHALHLTKLSTEVHDVCPKARFPPQSMPFDFDGKRLLWMNWTPEGTRVIRLLELNPFKETALDNYPTSFGHITHAKLQSESVIFVRSHRQLVQFYISNPTKQAMFGIHTADIVAVCISTVHSLDIQSRKPPPHFQVGLDVARLENQSQLDDLVEDSINPGGRKETVIVSVDENGFIKVWHEFEEKELIHINEMNELNAEFRQAQYFSMGYPYLVRCFAPRIAISTDHGVLVIKSRFLEALQMGLSK